MTTRSLSIASSFLSRTPSPSSQPVAAQAGHGSLPPLSSASALVGALNSPSLKERLDRLRVLLVDRLSLPSPFEQRLLRAARQRRPVVLGSVEQPFLSRGSAWREAGNSSPLEMLREFNGLQVRLTAMAEDILGHKNLLAELDRQHAVTVEVVLPGIDPAIPEVREALRTVRALAALGLAVRTVARLAPVGGTREALRQLFDRVRKAGAFDMRWVLGEEAKGPVSDLAGLCRCLSLEQGFPRAVVGRG